MPSTSLKGEAEKMPLAYFCFHNIMVTEHRILLLSMTLRIHGKASPPACQLRVTSKMTNHVHLGSSNDLFTHGVIRGTLMTFTEIR